MEEDFLFDEDIPTLWESGVELQIYQGFNTPLKDKVPGGKLNKEPLPTHVIGIEKCEEGVNLKDIVMKSYVCGYDKINKQKVELEHLKTSKLESRNGQWFCVFKGLVNTHSSHNNGQKLFLKFVAFYQDKIIGKVESYEFETITKRGMEKNLKKGVKKEDQQEAVLTKIDPIAGFRGSLIKIQGKNLATQDLKSIHIYFGNTFASKVGILQDSLVTEVPSNCTIGNTTINVSIDNGHTFLPSSLSFYCISKTDSYGIQNLVKYWVTKPDENQESLESLINKLSPY